MVALAESAFALAITAIVCAVGYIDARRGAIEVHALPIAALDYCW